MNATIPTLPPGQHELRGPLPKFGLPKFVRRWAAIPDDIRIEVDGDVECPLSLTLTDVMGGERAELTADLHCVTTWTVRNLHWSGRRFSSLWREVIEPLARPAPDVAYVRAWGLDRYAAVLPLTEALQEDALLADTLDGAPLSLKHGYPLRLVMPHLYGYKGVKHLCRLELRVLPVRDSAAWLAHSRGRVGLEERARIGPQLLWRWLYRLWLPLYLRLIRGAQREP